MKLGNNLRRCRFEHGEITQEKLAAAMECIQGTIHSIEKGKFNPSTLLALKMARFFNKPLEEIFFLVEEEEDKVFKKENNFDPQI